MKIKNVVIGQELVLWRSLSLIMERPWCKYLCPFGAAMGIGNLFRIFKIKRSNLTCYGI